MPDKLSIAVLHAAGGQGHGKDNAERAVFTALGYNFLRRAIGWDPR